MLYMFRLGGKVRNYAANADCRKTPHVLVYRGAGFQITRCMGEGLSDCTDPSNFNGNTAHRAIEILLCTVVLCLTLIYQKVGFFVRTNWHLSTWNDIILSLRLHHRSRLGYSSMRHPFNKLPSELPRICLGAMRWHGLNLLSGSGFQVVESCG